MTTLTVAAVLIFTVWCVLSLLLARIVGKALHDADREGQR